MEPSRYLECLATDYGALRDAAAAVELTVLVPTEVVRLTARKPGPVTCGACWSP